MSLVAVELTAAAGEPGFDGTHSGLNTFLGDAVSLEGVDYADLATRRPVLDAYLKGLEDLDASKLGPAAQKALWINAYNAITLRLILEEGQPASIMEIDGGNTWKARTYKVAGRQLSLDAIEQSVLRPMGDARTHAALNCASKGCPPLPPDPLTGPGIDGQLDAAMRRWVQVNAYELEGNELKLSQIFDWYAADFASADAPAVAGADSKQAAAIHYLGPYAGDAAVKLKSGSLTVSWLEYDWALNKR